MTDGKNNETGAFGGLMFSWQDMIEMVYRRRIMVLAILF